MTNTQTFVSRRERRRQAKPSIARAVASNAGTVGRGAAVAMASSGLVLTSGVAANASADDSQGREVTTLQVAQSDLSVERASSNSSVAVSASNDVELSFDRPVVTSTPAPEPAPEPEPEVAPQPATQQDSVADQGASQTQGGGQQESAQNPEQAQPASQSEPAAETESQPEPASAPSGGGNGSVVNAAYGYIGIPWSQMDCSAMIQNAYAQAGISVPRTTGGLMGLPQVSSPQPGDIVISNGGGHGAIYIGNGQVISSTASQGIRVHGLHEGWHNVVSYHRPG